MEQTWAFLHKEMEGIKKLVKKPSTIRDRKLLKAVLAYVNCIEDMGFALALEQQKQQQKAPRVWAWPYLQRRMEHGHYDNLMQELATECPELFKNYTRMSKTVFDEIVEAVTPLIQKQRTNFRRPVPPGLRVAVTIRFLATGDTYQSLSFAFRVAANTISLIVPETCRAIISVYGETLVKLPQSSRQWEEVAQRYEDRWNLPHCLGAIDGKHIRIRKPKLSGSWFYNYKKFFSIVLLAIVDADYKFQYVDVGAVGSESDGGVWAQTQFVKLLDRQDACIPPPKALSNDPNGPPTEYFFVADDAFPLRSYLMKPFPQRGLTKEERIYNYRMSRARMTVENAFGILANRFRIFHTSICLKEENIDAVVLASCILHNMLRNQVVGSQEAGDFWNPDTQELQEGTWRSDPAVGQPLPQSQQRATQAAKHQRECLKNYFNSPQGSVPWQNRSIS